MVYTLMEELQAMNIGIIGAGRAGSALGRAAASSGLRIAAVADLVPERAAALAGEVGASIGTPAQVAAAAGIIILSLPDQAIAAAAGALAPEVAGLRDKVFFHLAGAYPAELLAPLRPAGSIGSFHPLLALTGTVENAAWLHRCYYALEGDQAAVDAGTALVARLGGRSMILKAEDKMLYHAAGAMASNYLVALIDTAMGLFAGLGLAGGHALAAVMPLLQATLANVASLGPAAALTGPISRGDTATVAAHLAAIGSAQPARAVYEALGRATISLASRAGRLAPDRARELEMLMKGGEEDG